MTTFSGILLLTVRELWAKRVVIGLFIVSSLVLLSIAFALNLDVVEGSLAGMRLFGAEASPGTSLEQVVVQVEAVVAGAAYWVGILLALFASAPLFTTLLDEGHVGLLLSKPMPRWQLLGGHVLGVWATMFGFVLYLLGGTWLLMSIKSGVWNPTFLLSTFIVVALFAVMYGVVVAVGVLTESTALSLIVAYGLIFASIVLAGVNEITPQLSSAESAVFYGLYHVLPNFTEVTQVVASLARGETVADWYPLVSALLFGAGCYALGGWVFQRADY